MFDEVNYEDKIQELRTKYDAVRREAEEDGRIDAEERALLDKVGAKIAELESKQREAARAEGETSARSADAPDVAAAPKVKTDDEAAWKAVVRTYRHLQAAYEDMVYEKNDSASDLKEYLDKIARAVTAEDWGEAVNQVMLADGWFTIMGYASKYGDPEDTEEDDVSGVEAWDLWTGHVDALRDLYDQLDKEGSEHAPVLKGYLDRIDKADEQENYSVAIQQITLATAYLNIHGLVDYEDENEDEEDDEYYEDDDYGDDVEGGDDDDTEETPEEDPATAKAAWDAAKPLYKSLQEVSVELGKSEWGAADEKLDRYLDDIDIALSAEDWGEALNLVMLAHFWADENKLFDLYWSEEDDEESKEKAKAAWDEFIDYNDLELDELKTYLDDEGSPHAAKIGDYKKKIDEAVEAENWKKALQQSLICKKFIEDNDLWDEEEEYEDDADDSDEDDGEYTGPIEEPGDDKAAWDAFSGQPLDDLRNYYKKFGKDGYWEEEEKLKGYLDAIARAVATEDWAEALNQGMIAAAWLEDEEWYKVYPEDEPIELYEDEDDTGETAWEEIRGNTYHWLIKLRDDLKADGSSHAKKIGEFIKAIDDAEDVQNWKLAQQQVMLAMKYIDDNELGENPDDVADSSEWDARRADYDELVSLHERLINEAHPDAAPIGRSISEITGAIDEESYTEAVRLLDEARTYADNLELWDTGINHEAGIDPSSASIRSSVGQGGRNRSDDVETVQLLLNRQGQRPSLVPDGDCGKKTIGAIKAFQQKELGWKDGRVDPDGKTWRALTGQTIIDDVANAITDVKNKAGEVVDDITEAAGEMLDDAMDYLGDLFDGEEENK